MRTPQETTEAIKREYEAALHNVFPMETGTRGLHLEKVHFGEVPSHDDYSAQKGVVLKNGTWGMQVHGTFSLKDKDGNVLEHAKVPLGKVPTPTNRHTFIVSGREYSVSNQRRSKAGIYTTVGNDGEPATQFNLAHGKNFEVTFDPKTDIYSLNVKSSSGSTTKVVAYPVLKHVFGMSDPEIAKYVGTSHLEANRSVGEAKAEDEIKNLWGLLRVRNMRGDAAIPKNLEEYAHAIKEIYGVSQMDPKLNQMTVGHGFDKVSGTAIARGMELTKQMHQGEIDPTNRDHIAFSNIHGVEDFLRERLEKKKNAIASRIRNKLSKRAIADLGISNVLGGHVNGFFTTSDKSRSGNQVNALEMAENIHKVTVLGEGGISESIAVPDSARNVNPSLAGFVDPVRTPDTDRAGIDMRFAVNVKKDGQSISTLYIDPKTGQKVRVRADDTFDKFIGFDKEQPDVHGLVRAVHRGQYVTIPKSKLDYLVPTDDQFTVSTTLVPFLQNSHAHRSAMGAKMLNQALSLKEREAPIVDTIHSERVVEGLLPTAPVAGTITSIAAGKILVKGEDGKRHVVNYAHDFPLNGNSFLHTDLHVKEGDSVKKGQVLGDNTFTKGGKLALGTNLHVAYVPYRGYNFEDGIIATESGAKKLVSQHMFTHEHQTDDRYAKAKTNQSLAQQYRLHFPGQLTAEQESHLDADGVVKPGTHLVEGDFIICAMRRYELSSHQALVGAFDKKLAEPFRDSSMKWDKTYPGVVTDVVKSGDTIKVTIKAHSPLEVGDKLAGRFGNKGVVVAILPDHEAPKTKDGKVPDLMLNPAGIITRMNPGQVYETVMSKALEHTGMSGKQFKHFIDPKNGNSFDQIKKIVSASGVSPTDEFIDGKTGHAIGQVLNGKQYMLKLEKQAEVGYSARAFGSNYDVDFRPSKGGDDGAKAVGTLDFYAFLAHDARGFLREAATHKAEQNREVFRALHNGMPLPPPKPTYAYEKFMTMTKGMGLNIKKEGTKVRLLPMTDKDVLALSNGEIKEPLVAIADKQDEATGLPFKPEKGGLFDPAVTGGLQGRHWSHISLTEPMVNPVFAHATQKVLGLSEADMNAYVSGDKHVEVNGKKLTGGYALQHMLAQVNPEDRLKDLSTQLKATSNKDARKKIYTKIRYLTPLARTEIKAHEAYMVNHVPVIPPNFRPIYPDPRTGKIMESDANKVYRNLLLINNQMKEIHPDDLDGRNKARVALHEAFKKVQGLDGESKDNREGKGFLKIIAGDKKAKEGYFQSKLMSRVQDVAARGVAVPDPTLGIDEVGLPEPMAWKLYRPMVSAHLVRSGIHYVDAAKHVKNQSELARAALGSVMRDHPVILTRAPSLHKFNTMAFKPTIVPGRSVRTNTLINKGFNLDHDGDALNVHVPLGPAAVQDAWKMLPSNNLFSPLNRNPVHEPSQETVMGLWKSTNTAGKKAVRKFKTHEEAMAAYNKGEIKIDDAIEVGA